MGGNSRGPLTEPMFYVLMSFLRRDMCGTEITEFVERKTRGRVKLGPGTLYTLLGKFQDEKLIQETEVDGRKRTYRITPKGRAVYQEEVDRLRSCLMDAEEEGNSPRCPPMTSRGWRAGSRIWPSRGCIWHGSGLCFPPLSRTRPGRCATGWSSAKRQTGTARPRT